LGAVRRAQERELTTKLCHHRPKTMQTTETRKCPTCGGTGWRTSKWASGLDYRCTKCEGTGADVEKPSPVVGSSAWVGAQAWTIDKPRASGVWWWWKGNRAHKPELVQITAEPWMESMGLGPIMQWPGLTRRRNVFLVGGVWAGPVEPPELPDAESAPTKQIRD
jgi:hypothetical protein